jgi:hypothetical protein
MLTHSIVYPSIPSWVHRITTPSYRRSFPTRCLPPYQITLRNGSLRSRSCVRTRSRSCYQWLCGSCQRMEMGFLDHVVVIWIQFGFVGVHHARGKFPSPCRQAGFLLRPEGHFGGTTLTTDLISEHPLQTCSPTKEINRKR